MYLKTNKRTSPRPAEPSLSHTSVAAPLFFCGQQPAGQQQERWRQVVGAVASQAGGRSDRRGLGTWWVAAAAEGAGQSGMASELNEAAWREGRWASSSGLAQFFGSRSC